MFAFFIVMIKENFKNIVFKIFFFIFLNCLTTYRFCKRQCMEKKYFIKLNQNASRICQKIRNGVS